jgi:protein CpxP
MSGKLKSMGKIVVVVCVVAIASFAGMAQAHEGGCDYDQGGNHHRHQFMKDVKKLKLTDAQKAQAKILFQANREAVKPIIASLRAERHNLQALIHTDTVDEAAIRAESVKIGGIMADLNVSRAKAGAQFRAILTPAQVATLKTLHQKHGEATTAPVIPPPAPAPGN